MADVDRDLGALEARTTLIEARLAIIEDRLGRLLDAAAMGKGAWWAILRIGGVILAVTSAGAWLWDRRPQ